MFEQHTLTPLRDYDKYSLIRGASVKSAADCGPTRKRHMNISLFRIILFLTLTVVPAGGSLHAQCSQPTQEHDAIIREAENDRYTTRRVEFIGHRYTRDMVLRRRINIGLQEGEFFTRRNLLRSLQNVSKLKQIYPVNMRDVELRLNRSDRTLDVTICFQEREKRRRKTR